MKNPISDFKRMILTAAFGLFFICGFAQEDYPKTFGHDYERAVQFFEKKKWMDEVIFSQGLNPKEVKAIVFPELIRYSALQDKLETFALESLYVRYGKAYANFSIGEFQIKPSFAEKIEIDFLNLLGDSEIGVRSKDTIQNTTNRAARVKRLKDKKAMLNYLLMFFKVMEKKYPIWNTTENKIKFFACAYNANYQKPDKEIFSLISKKFFTTGLISPTKYCYPDISLYYFLDQ